MTPLKRDTFNAIITLLMPHLGDVMQQQTFVNSALRDAPALMRKINYAGGAHNFTVHLVMECEKFGEATPGVPAVAALLLHLRSEVGEDIKRQIDALIGEIMPADAKGEAAPSNSLKDIMQNNLRDALEFKLKQYDAVYKQYLLEMDAASKVILHHKLKALEDEIKGLEGRLGSS